MFPVWLESWARFRKGPDELDVSGRRDYTDTVKCLIGSTAKLCAELWTRQATRARGDASGDGRGHDSWVARQGRGVMRGLGCGARANLAALPVIRAIWTPPGRCCLERNRLHPARAPKSRRRPPGGAAAFVRRSGWVELHTVVGTSCQGRDLL